MKLSIASASTLVTFGTILLMGCMDRDPGPVCPVPAEVSNSEELVAGFNGVDLLVVVDNSASMTEEQAILATGFFNLINYLVNPISSWAHPAVENMRVAVVSSDMGLQYGDGQTDGIPNIANCSLAGDDGAFQHIDFGVTGLNIGGGQIVCEEGGNQCPEGFSCQSGLCEASEDPYWINCPSIPTAGNEWAETGSLNPNDNLATEVACMSALGATGCGIEQQLQAGAKALKIEGQGGGIGGFIKPDHLLAVLVVTDEEDCSIEDPGLFDTPEWQSGSSHIPSDPDSGHLNTACNFPASNESDFLYDVKTYRDQFVDLKDGNHGAVVFAAIAGVPTNDVCQGAGDQIGDCLSSPDMQLEEQLFEYENSGGYYYHFAPACTNVENGVEITAARPGRRYVELAELFGENGYTYSICNDDWGPAMEHIAEVIALNIKPQCYPKSLEWKRVDEPGCDNCGEATCDMVVTIEKEPGTTDAPSCPTGMERVEADVSEDGTISRVICRIPKIAAPLLCDQATTYVENHEGPGWHYCENLNHENFEEACSDNFDNDGDGLVDCDDTDADGCMDCSSACGGEGGGTCLNKCMYSIEMNEQAKNMVLGHPVNFQCLQQFNLEDGNCQENSKLACNNGLDDDGNGVWDCRGTEDHFADPNCCPLTISQNNICTPTDIYETICPNTPVFNDDLFRETVCEAHARIQKCTLIH